MDPLSKNIDHSLKDIVKYRKYPSIIAIASEFTKEYFSFNTITIEDTVKEISMLGSSKAIQATDITVKVIKGSSSFFAEQIYAYFNESISIGKISEISEISEKLLRKQLLVFFDNISSKLEYGFRKGYGTQSCLLTMLEKTKTLEHC